MSTESPARAWMEVRGSALRRNLQSVKETLGERVAVVAVVKADAYGLGVAGALAVFEGEDPYAYGVATVDEGVELRRLGVTRPVLVLTPTPTGEYGRAAAAGLTVSLSTLDGLEELGRSAREGEGRIPFHVEIDTGMGRAGFDPREVRDWGPLLAGAHSPTTPWSGVFTHFHSADEADLAPTHKQWSRFTQTLDSLDLPPGVLVHACNSAGWALGSGFWADAVRPGIFLYGGRVGPGGPVAESVVSVRARVVHLRTVFSGDTVGYGATYRAAGAGRWATVAIGYGDGLPRSLGNRGSALIRGRRVPIVGRISMDLTVVDISGLDRVELGEAVTFLGRDGDEEIALAEVAGWASTIDYEILTGFTQRIPRIWLDDGGR